MKIDFKSILNATWKVGLGLIGAGAAVFCIILAIAFWQTHYGRDVWSDRALSWNVIVRAYENNTVRIWNKNTKKYTTRKIRWVSGDPCEGDSLTVYCDKEGKRGYVNVNTGEIAIPAQYNKAWNFSEGLALDWSHTLIEEPNNGYRIVGNDDGYWLLDENLNKVFPDIYDGVSYADDCEGVYLTKNYRKQLVSYDGKVIEPFVIDSTYRLEYEEINEAGDAHVRVMMEDVIVYRVNAREGLMDSRTGRIITPACYCDFEMASRDLIRAKLGYGESSIVMDKNGKVVE